MTFNHRIIKPLPHGLPQMYSYLASEDSPFNDALCDKSLLPQQTEHLPQHHHMHDITKALHS